MNERRQILLESDAELKHSETLSVSLQNFVHACLFVMTCTMTSGSEKG